MATAMAMDAGGLPVDRIALRRDGARPLCFHGAALMSHALDDDGTGARFALGLFLAEDGGVVARVTVTPPPHAGGAPIHHAARIAVAEDLDALLDRVDPAAALPTPTRPDPALFAVIDALRDAYRRFGIAARRSARSDPTSPPTGPAGPSHPPEDAPMNTMTSFAEPSGADRASDVGGIAMSFSIARFGQKPLAFNGVEMAMAMNFTPKAPCWYEIALYRTADSRFVLAVKLFYTGEETDISRAWEFDSYDAAVTHLEEFDPADDVRVDVQPDDPSLSLPEMAAHALALRARATEARRQYRALVGEILHTLDAA